MELNHPRVYAKRVAERSEGGLGHQSSKVAPRPTSNAFHAPFQVPFMVVARDGLTLACGPPSKMPSLAGFLSGDKKDTAGTLSTDEDF